MRRFWIDPKCVTGKEIFLKGSSFHHIVRVCRFQKGQKFILLSCLGKKYLVELTEVSRSTATALILEESPVRPAQKPLFHLALSCPRFSVLESVLCKGVELGVSNFHPFISDFSFVKNPQSIGVNRVKRWEGLIQRSMAQSLNSMTLHSMDSLNGVINKYAQSSHSAGLFFYEGEEGKRASSVFESLTSRALNEVWIFIGSEGGFSSLEVSLFKSYGLEPLTLGNQILKVETACLTVLGVLKYKLGQI